MEKETRKVHITSPTNNPLRREVLAPQTTHCEERWGKAV
jgi:hypothetical protein